MVNHVRRRSHDHSNRRSAKDTRVKPTRIAAKMKAAAKPHNRRTPSSADRLRATGTRSRSEDRMQGNVPNGSQLEPAARVAAGDGHAAAA